jgi:hypothetical protein
MVRGGRELVLACSRMGAAGWFGIFWVVFQSSFAFEEKKKSTWYGCKGSISQNLLSAFSLVMHNIVNVTGS